LKAILSSPTYGPTNPYCQRDLRLAVIHAAKRNVEWVGGASVDGYDLETARNKIVRAVIGDDADGIMWVDSDMSFPPDSITKLLETVRETGRAFVAAVGHQRRPIHNPCIFRYLPQHNAFLPLEGYPTDKRIEVDGTGFSFCWTSMDLLRSIKSHPKFVEREGWFPLKKAVGGHQEDLEFCLRAKWVGVKPLIETSLRIGHLGDAPFIHHEDFVREREKWRAER
jgi:hypothetical protein